MTAGQGLILVSDSQYFVQSTRLPDISGYSYRGSNGLVAALAEPGVPAVPGQAAVVYTGTEFGDVSVAVEILQAAPDPQPAAWDEVVEISLRLADGGFVMTVGEADEDDPLPDLPAGDLRLRVHARGRDAGYESGEGEEHLLQVWAAPSAPGTVLKTSDLTGRRWRGEPPPTDPEPGSSRD